jgi:hypothetical protein
MESMHVTFLAHQGTSTGGVRSVHASVEWSCLVLAASKFDLPGWRVFILEVEAILQVHSAVGKRDL